MYLTALEAPITGVTVFTDGARVQRTGAVTLAAGRQTVVIGGLPASLDPASVRVTARGTDLALLNVEVRHGYAADPLREQVARLRAEVERCRDAVQALDDEDAAEQARLDFLGHLSGAAATALARAVSFGRAGHDELTGMAGHLSADTARRSAAAATSRARRRAARRELEAAERRLDEAEKRAGQPTAFSEVAATLEAARPAGAGRGGGLLPRGRRFLAAAVRPDAGRRAAGRQLPGRGDPADRGGLARRRAGAVHHPARAAPGAARARPLVHPAGPAAAPPRGPSGPGSRPGGRPGPPPQCAAVAAAGTVRPPRKPPCSAPSPSTLGTARGEAWAGVAYQVQRPLAVPADGGPQKTSIARFDLDAALDHLTVPVLAPEAYLRATATNTSSLLLLPGPARVFHGTQFTGETTLETVAAGEEIELQLGVDDQVRVERQLRRRSTGKAVIGGTRTIDIGYEITVENHRRGAARVTVKDRIPVSADGDIKVRLREASPAPGRADRPGRAHLGAAARRREGGAIRYRFTVEHPAQVTVTGL